MTLNEYYGYYVALKHHFSKDDFDFFKCDLRNYSRKINNTDRKLFTKIQKFYKTPNDFVGLVISNFLDDNIHITSFDDDLFTSWKKRIQGLHYYFSNDLNFLFQQDFNGLFEVRGGEKPRIVSYALQHKISIETFIILNEILNFVPKFDKHIHDYYWPTFKQKCFKYRPFLKFNTAQYKEICRTILRRN